MPERLEGSAGSRTRPWVTRTVVGIALSTLFSDFSHEMATAVLPLYLATVGLGPAALGVIEGLADFLVSLSKLGGGVAGHYVRRKREIASLGYLVTALGTGAIALSQTLAAILTCRSVAWIARGFRGPLRDDLLANAVEPTHYGRAYGLERAGDMAGAVAGPLAATLLIGLGVPFRAVILWALIPGTAAAAAMFFMTRERSPRVLPVRIATAHTSRPRIPRRFWLFLVGVFLFGMGDFSRTFLIWLAGEAVGENGGHTPGAISIAVLLYTFHNLVSAGAAYPVGALGDRRSKMRILTAGYALGIVTNLILAGFSRSVGWLAVAFLLSGMYIAVEETLEKATAAELLPPELRSLGFGILASANAVGDMLSSLYVGALLQAGRPALAFGIAAGAGLLGVMWLGVLVGARRARPAAAW